MGKICSKTDIQKRFAILQTSKQNEEQKQNPKQSKQEKEFIQFVIEEIITEVLIYKTSVNLVFTNTQIVQQQQINSEILSNQNHQNTFKEETIFEQKSNLESDKENNEQQNTKTLPISLDIENEQEPYSQVVQNIFIQTKQKNKDILEKLEYSPIKQASKCSVSENQQSVEPFKIDFESSSNLEEEILEWKQTFKFQTNGEILVQGNVKCQNSTE